MFGYVWRRAWLFAAVFAVVGCTAKKESGGDSKGAATQAQKAESPGGETTAPSKGDPGVAAAPKHVGPVAKVNGVEIPWAEFDVKYDKMTKAFTTRKKEIPENLARRYRESIVKQLIDKELLRQKIDSEKVEVPAAELDAEFDNYKKMFKTDKNFERYLESASVDVEQIKSNISHNLAVKALLEKTGDIGVTEDEAKDHYEKNKQRYEVKEQVRASHILLKVDPKATKEEDEKVKKRAAELYQEAKKKGADFAELAKQHSEGPTARKGGDLSYFTRGRMVKEFEDVAFKMKNDEIAKPIKTQFGWHVIKVTDHKEGRVRPFDEVRESIEKLVRNRKERQAKQALLKDLRANAKIESFLPDEPAPAEVAGAPAAMPEKLADDKAATPKAP